MSLLQGSVVVICLKKLALASLSPHRLCDTLAQKITPFQGLLHSKIKKNVFLLSETSKWANLLPAASLCKAIFFQ